MRCISFHLFHSLAVAALMVRGSLATANIVNWIGGTDSNWTTPANWSGAVLPGIGDDAVLNDTVSEPYTIYLPSGAQNINSLTAQGNPALDIDGGTLSLAADSEFDAALTLSSGTLTGNGNVTINDTFNWAGGAMSGTGSTIISPAASFYIVSGFGASVVNLSRTVEDNGQTAWGNGDIDESNAAFTNNGTFVASSNSTLSFYSGDGSSILNNTGDFIKEGTGTAVIYASPNTSMEFSNSGVVYVETGTLTLSAGGNNTGSFYVDSDGNLLFNSSFTIGANASLTGSGTVSFSGGNTNFPVGTFTPTGPVNFVGGVVTINNAFTPSSLSSIIGQVNFNDVVNYSGNLSIAGEASFAKAQTFNSLALAGTLDGAGNVTISGNMNWTGGTMTGAGTTIISSGANPNGATLIINASTVNLNRILENDGTTTWLSGTIKASSSVFNNTGTFTANSAGTLACFSIEGTNVFNNSGSFVQQGFGTTQFYVSSLGSTMVFNNTGTVAVYGGTLQLLGPVAQLANTTLTGGTWNIYYNGTLALSSGINITTLGPQASVQLDGPNAVFANINSLNENDGAFTITDGRNFTPTSAFTNTGTLTISFGSTFEATAPLSNTGTIDLAGGILKLDAGLLSTSVLSQLLSGFNAGQWNGPGIISSFAAADPNHASAVGYTKIGSNYTLVFTSLGDTDLNGIVNGADLQNMAPSGTTNATWSEGDFNYNGVVNADDYGLFILGSAYQEINLQLVPEPDIAFGFLGLAMIFFSRWEDCRRLMGGC